MTRFADNDIATIAARERRENAARERSTVLPNGFTIEELRNAMNNVQDPDDWKNPINATIHPSLLQVTLLAIEFFTATKGAVAGIGANGRVTIHANGYHCGPAGDH